MALFSETHFEIRSHTDAEEEEERADVSRTTFWVAVAGGGALDMMRVKTGKATSFFASDRTSAPTKSRRIKTNYTI